MSRRYHVLFGKEEAGSRWEMLFASYTKDTVWEEYRIEIDAGGYHDLRVDTLDTDTHEALMAKLVWLNKEV